MSRSATAAPRPGSSPACRPISPPTATSRPPSPAARSMRSGWPPRWNATTGPARSAATSGYATASWPGSWAATSAASANNSRSCAPARRLRPSGSPSSGTPTRKTRAAGRYAPASSPGAWGSPTATCAMSPGNSAARPASHCWPSGSPAPTSSWPAHPHRSLVALGSGTGGWRPPAARSTRNSSSPNPGRSPRRRRPRPSAPAVGSGDRVWRRPCTAPRPTRTTPASSPAPPPATASACAAGPRWPREPDSSRTGRPPSRP